ncbi:f-box domain-containing protein [Fusarium phyllophilum]|uniref:F-box domain-containing protein n=1 Tax=Fusarium phyllophilum TaxID=47803 RepID=A0A8H5JPH0_9HYPO|nr:f-box domain-containing protein [Fusarium phyllophilum]
MVTFVETINILRFEIIPRLSIRDQLHLCQTSKDLHTATVSVLYRDITITHDVEAPDSPPPEPKELRRLERIRAARRKRLPWGVGFLFAILSRPALRSHVKSLRFRIENYVHEEHFRDTGKLKPLTFHPVENENARQLIVEGIDELSFSETEKLNGAFADRDFDLILSLIIAACTEVQSLTIDLGYFLYSHRWLLKLFKNSLSPQNKSNKLQNVTHFEVANPRGWLGYQQLPRGIHPLSFYLPNARTLSLESFASHRKASFICTAGYLSHYASSGSLLIKHSHNITAMLAQTPNLKTLFYACYLPAFEYDFKIDELRRGLEHVPSEDWQPLADLLPPNLISLTIRDELWNDHATFRDIYTEVAIRDMMRTFLSSCSRSSTLSLRHVYFYRYPAIWAYENLSKGPEKEYYEDWKPVDDKYGSRWVLAER